MFVVTYNSLDEFKEFVERWAGGRTPLHVRISQREYHELSLGGRVITHFVALQARVGDEIHLCKFHGPEYEYLGVQWDFKQRQPEGLKWSADVYGDIIEFCAEEGYEVLPGWLWIENLGSLIGSKFEGTVPLTPLTVRIEVRGGVAHVEEAPDCVEVIIDDRDGDGS